jgi:uncharacterized protein YjbI with pentapeptide repeats
MEIACIIRRENVMKKASEPSQLSASDDVEWWIQHWKAQGEPWRMEPEIDIKRQDELQTLRATFIDISHNVYPFHNFPLSRADIEWLLSTHESEGQRGPVLYDDERQWRRKGIDISGANLAKVDLSNLPLARLKGVSIPLGTTVSTYPVVSINLERANLTNARLEGADLAWGSLRKANLTGAYLEDANLTEAHLEDADCSDSHFEEANLCNTHLERASLTRAHAEEASFRDAHLEHANCGEAHFAGANFVGAYLTHVRFTKAHLESSDFRRASTQQTNADFRGVYLEGANLEEASLEKADFRDAHLEGCSFRESHLEDADLRRAWLAGADLRAAHLEGTNLKEAHLEGKRLRSSELARIREWSLNFPEELGAADLREALFSSATRLKDAVLGDIVRGFILVADISWSDANLNVIDWDAIHQIGDERRARLYRGKNKLERLEEYRAAVRANRQLAVTLRDQGLDEVAARFSYNAQRLQQRVFHLQRNFGRYLLSILLSLLVGYGYKPMRSFIAYLTVILLFMLIYHTISLHLSWRDAFIISATAFGRGFAPGSFTPADPTSLASVFEAFTGLIIEATFIAALTQRFFGK